MRNEYIKVKTGQQPFGCTAHTYYSFIYVRRIRLKMLSKLYPEKNHAKYLQYFARTVISPCEGKRHFVLKEREHNDKVG